MAIALHIAELRVGVTAGGKAPVRDVAAMVAARCAGAFAARRAGATCARVGFVAAR